MIDWLSFLGSLLWNGLSYSVQHATSSVGFSIAGILAVWKTDINKSLVLITLSVMCAMMISGLLYMCKLLADVFIEIGRAIQYRNNFLLPIILPLIKLLIFSCVFFPVMNIMIHIISFFPALVLYVGGHHKEADFYMEQIMGKNAYRNRR